MSAIKRKNPMKTMAIISIVLLVLIITLLLVVKRKVYLEDENGTMYAGKTGVLGVKPESEREKEEVS